MGLQAIGAILNTTLRIGKAAAAAISQGIQGAIAKQAAEFLRVSTGMAGKILALLMLEKIVICHRKHPFLQLVWDML